MAGFMRQRRYSFAVAPFAILVAQLVSDTCQPAFGMFDSGLCVPPGLLGPGFNIVVEYPLRFGEGLYGLGTRRRVTG